ncbi:hypothetical protein [Hyalangium versicolor]|uniref:hypothetical protein n=1 Tax=Hyalangium versicolor TaxID=2861190 RepID=UPI001CCF2DC3|nr:hypothetical protein [Hyalangium versicolor]
MRWMLPCLLVSSALCGCSSSSTSRGGEPAAQEAASGACPLEKIRVTQATGCLSDGSLEFCVPKEDVQLAARLRALVPTLRTGESRGRAGCDPSRETLYFFDTGSNGSCVDDTKAMTDAAWEKVCRIAAEPAIQQIVPTWYE